MAQEAKLIRTNDPLCSRDGDDVILFILDKMFHAQCGREHMESQITKLSLAIKD